MTCSLGRWMKMFYSGIICLLPAMLNGAQFQRVENNAQLVEDLLHRADSLLHLQPDSSLISLRQAWKLAIRENLQLEILAAGDKLGDYYKNTGSLDSAKFYFDLMLEYGDSLNIPDYHCKMLSNLAWIAFKKDNDPSEAIDLYQEAKICFQESGDTASNLWVTRSLAAMYRYRGAFSQSLEFSNQARRLAEKLTDKTMLGIVYNDIGVIYMENDDYLRADTFFKHGLRISQANRDLGNQGIVLNNMGRNLGMAGNLDEALPLLNRSYELQDSLRSSCYSVYPLYNMGHIYFQMKRLDSAIQTLNKTLKIGQECNNQYIQVLSLIDLGSIQNIGGNQNQAIQSLGNAVELSESAGLLKELMEAARELYELYKSQNNDKKALQYHELYHATKDTVFNRENDRKIARLEANNIFAREKEALKLQNEKELLIFDTKLQRQRTIQALTIVGLLLSIAFIFIISRYNRLRQKANKKLYHLNEELAEQKEVVERQKDRLVDLDNMKSHFFTNISHELRTPLTVIKGMTTQIEGNERSIALIKRNVENLLRLVNQILDLRKLESGNLSLNLVQSDILVLSKYILEPFYGLAEAKNISLKWFDSEAEIIMDHDPEKMGHVISNLLSNAIKYTPAGGEVSMSVKRNSFVSMDILEITVKDSGIGIAADQLTYIFNRFFQVDQRATPEMQIQGGTGIGLAYTKELVQIMEGHIEVKSKPGAGTTFILKLPIKNKALLINSDTHPAIGISQPSEDPKPEKGSQIINGLNTLGSRPSLLLIEDNPDVLVYVLSILDKSYQVRTAANGQLGVDLALKYSPDLILSDVMMPGLNGFEVCSTLKNDIRTMHIPIILMSAKADQEARINGLEKGADAYLVKPFREEELLVQIETLLQSRVRQLQRQNVELQRLVKEKTREIMAAHDQLILQEKLVSLGQISAGIAHEIKNPLNFVNNFAEGSIELLEELKVSLEDELYSKTSKGQLSEIHEIIQELEQNAQDIYNNGLRANAIVVKMLEHVRNNHIDSMNINQLIDSNLNIACHAFRAVDSSFNVHIEKKLDQTIGLIDGKPNELSRAILNIINNAFHSMQEKQREKPKGYRQMLFVSSSATESHQEIRIRDNGQGIPEQMKSKIFEPFFSTKMSQDGHSGLGLSIAYDIIVRGHGGKISLSSELGEFSEFILLLPSKDKEFNNFSES